MYEWSEQWAVGIMGCRNNGPQEQWAVGIMGCRNNGSSELWAVGIMTRNPYLRHGIHVWRWASGERRPLILYTNKAKLSGLGTLSSLLQWASGEIRKTTTYFVYEQSKTLRTRSAELIIALNTPKASGLSLALF